METEQKKRKGIVVWIGAAAVLLALAAGGFWMLGGRAPKGCYDYTVQKKQYYVEYSDKYDYWDVLTVEYPVLSALADEVEEEEEDVTDAVNKLLYDMAMEQVEYWHLSPNDEVKELQEEYHIFSSDVHCAVPYHSQYLLSVHFQETYAPISPVYYIHKTQRSANINLLTGGQYALSDIFQVNEDFIGLWCAQVESEGTYGDLIRNDADTRETFLAWFLDADEEAAEHYLFTPFFYMDGDKNFVIGLSYVPKPDKVVELLPMENSFLAHFAAEDLMPYKTDSDFWELYERSESTGEVLECENLEENLWLGKEASVWEYREEMDLE